MANKWRAGSCVMFLIILTGWWLMLGDWAFVQYAALGTYSLYGFGLFCVWHRMADETSDVFFTLMFVWLGLVADHVFGAYARWLRFEDAARYYETMSTLWWANRCLLLLISSAIFLSMMSYRFFYLRRRAHEG